MVPCYLMTFMLGPIGLLFYFAIRTAKTRATQLEGCDRANCARATRSCSGPGR